MRKNWFQWTVPLLLFAITALIGGCSTNALQGKEMVRIDIRGSITDIYSVEKDESQAHTGDGKIKNPDTPVSSSDSPDERTLHPDLLGTVTVEGKLEQDTSYDKAGISIRKSTKIYKKAGGKLVAAHFKDLQAGSEVEVTFTGPVAESYPVQAIAEEIVILRNE
ncbi:DUF3221 domain-containing protein [Paenibacillus sp. J2TS4]|uniref:DUF3221 domain-containing protein n=1 Tax=Paenibacillus sp. J2TS4 TaxID=2807194 RepID=UPI001B0192E2|nr:DUF3221 domain-containing protein [Paenibacillus sp. J2TS4]GIP32088.1 hypothetical protein J2TS4_12980 [Paenibacillus sp. J2TS4]